MKYRYQYNNELSRFSRTNRKQQTDAEKVLWHHLRNRQLAGLKFRRQYPVDKFILDFYCIEKKIAIELDGSQHIENQVSDEKRSKVLKTYGINVLRYWDNEVLLDVKGVLSHILKSVSST